MFSSGMRTLPSSGAMPALPIRQRSCDQMGRTQRLGQARVDRERVDERDRGFPRQANVLQIHLPVLASRPELLDQLPLASTTADGAEQRTLYAVEIGLSPTHGDHWQVQALAQRREIDNVETRERNPLEQHGLEARKETRAHDQIADVPRRVDAIASNLASNHAFEPGAIEDSTDDGHVTTVRALERRVVETDNVGQPLGDTVAALRT